MTVHAPSSVIKVENLGKSFQSGHLHALEQISFAVAPHEIFGIIGRSGAGKTTLLRILSLQMTPDAGRFYFDATEIGPETSRSIRRAVTTRTATVFQGFSLLYNRTVLDNVALPLKLRGVAKSAREAQAAEMLDFVGLAGKLADYPITLSGGEAQRVAIARALVTDPEVLFLDEPTSALDAETSHEILDLLKKIHARYPMAMVLVAHSMNVVRYMCDRALHLDQGRVSRIGTIRNSARFEVDTVETLWEGTGHD
ncbi:ATP-binding cassette domain-containing protein [Celeribacter sp. ULVN23_4]